jgi:hypothetical protein
MSYALSTDKKIAVIGALAEGSSIRSIERITGIHRDTIMRLGVKVGQGCTALMDEKMRNLPCTRLEMDEIWGFVGKKDRHLREGHGHAKANKVYAWWHHTDGHEKRYVTVLHVPPAVSPLMAVRTFIAQEYRNAQQA